ncbi:MAG: methyltransferase small, partial [Actinotalea sp.]|nr:methyltransferase small [Actinotalea sp.]
AARLVTAPDVTEERHLRPGADDPSVVLLRQGDGFGRTVPVGTALAGFVGACDGELGVGQIVGALATLLEVGVEDLVTGLLPTVRDLVLDGFLRPVT